MWFCFIEEVCKIDKEKFQIGEVQPFPLSAALSKAAQGSPGTIPGTLHALIIHGNRNTGIKLKYISSENLKNPPAYASTILRHIRVIKKYENWS